MNPLHRGHIYLVDDNPEIRFHLSDLLQKRGYSVQAYDAASSFLKHGVAMFPAVLILDVRMPGMSGIELQQTLRAMGRQTPIVFISGECQSHEIIQAMKGLPIEFLLKPFSMDQLIEAVDRGMSCDRSLQNQTNRVSDLRCKWQTLTARERDVFLLMLEGHTNMGMSELLDILPDTIKKHRSNVLQKMHTPHLADLMALCKGLDVSSF